MFRHWKRSPNHRLSYPYYSTKNIFPTIPLPNWTLSWDGIGKIKQLKKIFSKVTVRHGYSSSYNVSGFNNNLFFNEDGNTQSIRKPVATQIGQPNFESFYNINSVTIREAFSPLLKLPMLVFSMYTKTPSTY